MNTSDEYPVAAEVKDTSAKKSHVVILGAGASLAAFPNGDANGRKLPLMNNLIDVVGLGPILDHHGLSQLRGLNFEEAYSEVHANGLVETLVEIENRIRAYFSEMRLPEEPTLYDYLVLSLRKKDVIATFNWDPFLWQACWRNRRACKLPQIAFLHGNVAIGACDDHPVKGPSGSPCPRCGKPLRASRLLFPVTTKNYTSDRFISAEWNAIANRMPNAFLMTIFGYGAPTSDAEAIGLMKGAWGNTKSRRFEQTEIVDIRPQEELEDVWQPFIHTTHFDTFVDLRESFLFNHPRRSVEAAWQQYIMAKFIEFNPMPTDCCLTELQTWIRPLVDAEDQAADLGC